MGFIYDNGITIPNNKTDGNKPSIPSEWVASDANLVANALLDTRTAIQGGNYFGLRDMSGGLPDVSASGNVQLISNAGVAEVSSDGRDYRPMFVTIDAREFGVVADGVTDDTAAIQAALDYGFGVVDVHHLPCAIMFPPGIMVASATLLWRGNSALSPALLGAVPSGAAFNFAGSTFKWNGVNNGVLFFAQSANKGVMQDLAFDGNSKAGILCHLSASTYADPTVLAATSGIRVLRCGFKACKIATVGNGCVALGTDPTLVGGATYQQSEVVFRDCRFVPEDNGAPGFTYAGMRAYGIKTLSPGNCKNFAAYDCEFNNGNVAVDWSQASGNFVVTNAQIADCRFAYKSSGGHLFVAGGDIEAGHVDDFRFLSGTGGGGLCAADISTVECIPFLAGAVGTMIEWAGQLKLTNCQFVNGNSSVSGDPEVPNPFKIILGGSEDSSWGSIYSTGNLFNGVLDFAPFYDTSGNRLAPIIDTSYGGNVATNVYSWGDLGYLDITGNPVPLGTISDKLQVNFEQRWNGPVNYSYLTNGDPADPYAAFRTICPVNAVSVPKTFTLPAAAAANLGRITIVTKHDSSTNTVTCNGVVLRNQFEAATFVSNGTTWDLLGIALNGGTQRIDGAKTFSAPILHSQTGSITAHAGGGQGSATALTTEVNVVATVASANDSVKLPTAAAGLQILVFNAGANAVDVYPATGGAIDALGTNNPYSVAATASRLFVGVSSTAWLSR